MAGSVKFNDKTQAAIKQVLAMTHAKVAEFVDTVTEIGREEAPFVTGTLKASINHDRPGTGSHRIFTQTGYGGYVHNGTRFMAGNPFLVRGLDRALPEFLNSGPWV